jgi:hypothetical protein
MDALSRPMSVCEGCWSLYVSEKELMQVEIRLAKAMGVVPPRVEINTENEDLFPMKGM